MTASHSASSEIWDHSVDSAKLSANLSACLSYFLPACLSYSLPVVEVDGRPCTCHLFARRPLPIPLSLVTFSHETQSPSSKQLRRTPSARFPDKCCFEVRLAGKVAAVGVRRQIGSSSLIAECHGASRNRQGSRNFGTGNSELGTYCRVHGGHGGSCGAEWRVSVACGER